MRIMTVCGSLATSVILGDSYAIHQAFHNFFFSIECGVEGVLKVISFSVDWPQNFRKDLWCYTLTLNKRCVWFFFGLMAEFRYLFTLPHSSSTLSSLDHKKYIRVWNVTPGFFLKI